MEQVLPEVVAKTSEGKTETVMYHFLPPMLLNECQKQQRTIAAQQARIEAQDARIATLASAIERLERQGR